MKPHIFRQAWENIIAVERSVVERSIAASVMAAMGFAIICVVYEFTGIYFSSLTIIVTILIGLHGGLYLSVFFAVVLAVAADYYFIPPIGSVFSSFLGYEHFFIITGLAIFVASLGSSLRIAFRRAILARQEAERVSLLMEEVLTLVSHDIRSPLSGVQMGCEFILGVPGRADKHRSILAMMLHSVIRADSMIESLLDAASMRAGKTISLEFQLCDLNLEVARMLKEMSLTKSDPLEFTGSEPVWGDWGISGIHRALENLVTNAVKYGAPGAPIAIKLRRKNDQAILSVHNRGREIPVEDQDKLFHAFQRAGGAEKCTAKGWGLGLVSVKGIAEAHGGVVTVESGKGTGTTFTLELPIRAPGWSLGGDPVRADGPIGGSGGAMRKPSDCRIGPDPGRSGLPGRAATGALPFAGAFSELLGKVIRAH
jgi:signal transduction histidine kinase